MLRTSLQKPREGLWLTITSMIKALTILTGVPDSIYTFFHLLNPPDTLLRIDVSSGFRRGMAWRDSHSDRAQGKLDIDLNHYVEKVKHATLLQVIP